MAKEMAYMRLLLLGCFLLATAGCGIMITSEDRPPTIPATDAGIAQDLTQEQAKAKQDALARHETPD